MDNTTTQGKAKRFSVRFVRNWGEFAGQVEGGNRSPFGYVKTSTGDSYPVYSMYEAKQTIAELRAEHKAAKKARGQ